VDLGKKLQLKPGTSVAVIGRPDDVELDIAEVEQSDDAAQADAVVAFVLLSADLDALAAPALAAARDDRLAWIAYPKAGQLGTDLNRDRLAAAAQERGVQPVRQVAIDDVWSALRFRPA
jgi:hypothetical protein